MTTIAQKLSNQHDELFQIHGGTLQVKKDSDLRCGYPAVMAYVKKTNEPLPLTPERMKQIEMQIRDRSNITSAKSDSKTA